MWIVFTMISENLIEETCDIWLMLCASLHFLFYLHHQYVKAFKSMGNLYGVMVKSFTAWSFRITLFILQLLDTSTSVYSFFDLLVHLWIDWIFACLWAAWEWFVTTLKSGFEEKSGFSSKPTLHLHIISVFWIWTFWLVYICYSSNSVEEIVSRKNCI